VSDLSLSLPRPSSLSSYFLSPDKLRSGSNRAVFVGTWHLSRPNQNKYQEGNNWMELLVIQGRQIILLLNSLEYELILGEENSIMSKQTKKEVHWKHRQMLMEL